MIETVRLLLWLRYRTMFRGGSSGRQIFAVVAGLLVLVPLSLGMGVLSLVITQHVSQELGPEALLLWVRAGDEALEATASEILTRHGAEDVHRHQRPAGR